MPTDRHKSSILNNLESIQEEEPVVTIEEDEDS